MTSQVSKPPPKQAHERLKLLRQRMGKSQAQMAGLLHISPRGYLNYEQGSKEIPVVTLERAQAHFGLNPAWVLDGEGEMFLPEAHPERARIQKALQDATSAVAPTAAPLPLDLERMRAAIHAMMLVAQKRGRALQPDQFAAACVFLYELSLQPGSMPLPRIAERLLETIA